MLEHKSLKIALIAGEPSGDQLGSALMVALKKRAPHVTFVGIGGPAMMHQGLVSIFPMQELSIMGIGGILKDLPKLYKRYRQTIAYLKEEKPDVLVTIDAPEFSLRVAKRLKGLGIQLVHYTPPTVWAWRPGRAKKIARILDHLLAIYPFEPPYFLKYGLATTFVGHAVVEKGIAEIDPQLFRQERQLGDSPILTLMPGSRRSEVESLLDSFQLVAQTLYASDQNLKIFVPSALSVKEIVQTHVSRWNVPVEMIEDEKEKYKLMRASTTVLAASGTVSLELAMAQVPFVIAYRVSSLTAWLARRLLRVPYVSMVNIIAERKVVPELLQEDCVPEKLCKTLSSLLYDQVAQERMKTDLGEIVKQLLPSTAQTPSDKAAEVVLNLV